MTQPNQPQNQEPREFIITFGGKEKHDTRYFFAKEKCLVESGICMIAMEWPKNGDRLKVIEFSAYQSLQQKVSELEVENKRLRDLIDETREGTSSCLENLQHYFENKCCPTADEVNQFSIVDSTLALETTKWKALKGEEK